MQERAYSAYCSLKHLSGQGYLSQESIQSGWTAFHFVGWWKNRHLRCKKCYAH